MANIVEVIVRGVDRASKPLLTPIKSLEDLKGAVLKLGPIVAGTAVGVATAFTALSAHAINVADETGKMAQKVGISTETLSALAYAGKLSDVAMDTLALGVRNLAQMMSDMAAKGVSAQTSLSRLGIRATDSKGQLRNVHDVLLEVADAFAGMEDGAEKTAMAVDIFGKAGIQMIPLLNQGKAAIVELEAKARSLGLVISDETAKQAEEFNDSLTTLKEVGAGFVQMVVKEILPNLSQFARALADNASNGDSLKKSAYGLSVTLKGLGTIALAIWHVALLLAQAVGVVLVVAFDLLIEAGKTLIKMFVALKDGAVNYAKAVVDAVKALGGFGDVISRFAKGDFKGAWLSAQQTVTAFAGEVVNAVGAVIGTWEGFGTAVQEGAKRGFNNAVAVAKEAYGEMQNDAGNFMNRLDAIWGEAPPTNKEDVKRRSPLPQMEDKALVEFENKRAEALLRARELEAQLREDQLVGSAKVLAQLENEYNQRSQQIARLNLEEDEALALSAKNYETYQAKLNDLAQSGALFRAEVDAAMQQGNMERLLQAYETQAALDAAQLEGRKQLLQQYQEFWNESHRSMFSYVAEAGRTLYAGLSNALVGIITNTKKAGEAFKQLGIQMVTMIVNFMVQRALAFVMEKAFAVFGLGLLKAAVAANTSAASALAGAWGAAATAAAIATFGAATAAGAAVPALMATNASLGASIAATAGTLGQAHSGLDYVPQTGTFLLKEGERVVQPEANRDLTEALANGGVGARMSHVQLVIDGRVLGEVIADLSRDGRIEIDERSIV